MKRNFWRKTAAFTLALTLATGSLPANAPLQDLFSGAVLTAHAEVTASGFCGADTNEGGEESITWSLEDGVLTISGEGAMKDYDEEGPWHDQASDITQVEIGDGVTTIGQAAFYQLTCMTSVTIPDSVTSIGDYAFQKCSNLTSVTIPEGVTSIGEGVFSYCTSLTSVTIPNSVTSIGEDAFYYCRGLTSVTMPESMTNISAEAFGWCTSLTSFTIPNSVTSIGDRAFYYCTSLTSVTIPESVTNIGEYAFAWCSSLTSVTIPDGVTSIDAGVFHYCQGLASVTIPDSVKTIDCLAFAVCDSLTSFTISASVTSINALAFESCKNLTEIIVDQQNPIYCSDNGVLFSKSKTQLHTYPAGKAETAYAIPDSVTSIGYGAFSHCHNLESVTIPDSVTSIEVEAFDNCISLASVTIPDSVTSIGEYAFCTCNGLESVTIPNSVTSIGDDTFYGCNLKSVTIPASVTSIGESAFGGCNALKAVIVERAETLTALASNAFVYYDYKAGSTAILPNVTIYVPAAKAEEYKNAENWSDYADRIIGYSDTQLPDGQYKQTAEKNGTYYTRFVFVVPKTDFADKSKAKFNATYNDTPYTHETNTYYTGVISNGVTYNPASSTDRAMFVVTVTSGSDISADLTCTLDFE